MSTFNPAILYVEDEVRSRRVMMMLANSEGLTRVTIFEDSTDFIPKIQALDPQPEIIFLDIHVTPLDGFEMLKLLRALPAYSKLPIVAMTASVMSEEIQQLRTSGFDGCISKPIDLDTFPESLKRIYAGEKIWRIV